MAKERMHFIYQTKRKVIKCPDTFEIRIAFENKKDHVINKIIEKIIVIQSFHSRSVKMNFKVEQFFNTFI